MPSRRSIASAAARTRRAVGPSQSGSTLPTGPIAVIASASWPPPSKTGAENAWITGQGQAEGFKFSIVIGEYAAWRVMGDAGDPALAEAFKYPTNEYPANARPFGGGDE